MLTKFDDDKLAQPSRLYPPRIGFDADYNSFKIRNTDERDEPIITCSINGRTYNMKDDEKCDYTLPLIDTVYTANYELTPTKPEFKIRTGQFEIFSNHEDCKYFRYSGDNYYSTDIYKYIGIKNNIVIPEKHNLTNTLSATLTKFPKVKSERITITTPKYMTDFWIKEDRIVSFTINGTLNAKDYQFTDLPILETVNGKANRFSKHMFDGETSLKTVNLSGATLVDDYAFYNCTGLTDVKVLTTITKINTYGFYNCISLVNPLINNCTNVGSYAFYNCKSLNMNPMTTYKINTLGEYSFFNTPSKTVCISASTLPVGCFDYNETPFQKVIFTGANTVNGLNRWTLVNGNYTNGMLYDGGKKHQVYCDLRETAWENEPAENDKVTIDYYTGYNSTGGHNGYQLPKDTFVFKAEDERVIGLRIRVQRMSGAKLKEMYWLPQMTGMSSYNVVLSNAIKPGDGHKYFYMTGTQLYDLEVNQNMDRITLQAIDRNGLMTNSYRYLQNGTVLPEYDPTSPIIKVLYLGTVTGNVNYSIDGKSYTAYFGTAPHYLYITGVDKNFTNLMARLKYGNTYINGSDGELTQYFTLDNDQTIEKLTISGKTVYKIDLDNYYNASDLNNNADDKSLMVYYEGFTANIWTISLSNLLNGSTNSQAEEYLSYTIIFDAMGGTSEKTEMNFNNGESRNLPNCTKSGYTFLGWYNEDGDFIGGAGDSFKATKSETLYAYWEESAPATPPEKLPDTVNASINIQKALCNTGTSSTTATVGSSGMITLPAKYLYLVQNPELTVRAELYDSTGKYINYYDLTKSRDLTSQGYTNVNGYSIATMENVSSSHTLKLYYRDNPSFGEFTIDLTRKTTYR